MAKNKNTFEKRQRELKRMRKAQEKRERRVARKQSVGEGSGPAIPIVVHQTVPIEDVTMAPPLAAHPDADSGPDDPKGLETDANLADRP